jgi:hypothetical protein
MKSQIGSGRSLEADQVLLLFNALGERYKTGWRYSGNVITKKIEALSGGVVLTETLARIESLPPAVSIANSSVNHPVELVRVDHYSRVTIAEGAEKKLAEIARAVGLEWGTTPQP